MKRITALPVAGDAYILETSGFVVLVDGGYSGAKLHKALTENFPGIKHLNVVICTHSDNDHAGGLTDFLNKTTLTVGEFWLPGSWAQPARDLLANPGAVMQELTEEVTDGPTEGLTRYLAAESMPDIDAWLDAVQREPGAFDLHRKRGQREAATEGGAQFPEGRTTRRGAAVIFGKAKRALRHKVLDAGMANRTLMLIDTAERIRKIAESARDHHVPVRWFDYSEYQRSRVATGGIPDFLVPVNSVELESPPALFGSLMRFVQLSRANRECLVFHSISERGQMSVLFCGDSPLGDGPRYVNSFLDHRLAQRPLVVTAPHHGSESNSIAYAHIKKICKPDYWIRTGSGAVPGSTFQAIDPVERACTQCPHAKHEVRQASITDWYPRPDPAAWMVVRSNDCNC